MSEADEEQSSRELAASNVNRAVTLIGSNMAIFTFVLFFLYPRYVNNQMDPILFQVTLTAITLTVFTFGLSGLQYYGVIGTNKNPTIKKVDPRKRDRFFVRGLLIATAEPALILYTIGLVFIAVMATLLWLLYTFFVLQQGRQFGYC